MKNAKFMLLGTAIVGVVGGALAFKAQKYNTTLWCSTTNTVRADNVNCILDYRTDPAPTTTMFCTDVLQAPCTITTAVINDAT